LSTDCSITRFNYQKCTLHNFFTIDQHPFKCKPCSKAQCATCTNINPTNQLTSTSYAKIINFKQNVDCGLKDLIYLITCSKCIIQYLVETGGTLRHRFSNHRSYIKHNEKNKKPTPIGIHFNSIGHIAYIWKLLYIKLLGEGDRLHRRAREAYWQTKLGTIFSNGLNNFPTLYNHLFINLLINSHTDLINFWTSNNHCINNIRW